jgi:hypothetical protein
MIWGVEAVTFSPMKIQGKHDHKGSTIIRKCAQTCCYGVGGVCTFLYRVLGERKGTSSTSVRQLRLSRAAKSWHSVWMSAREPELDRLTLSVFWRSTVFSSALCSCTPDGQRNPSRICQYLHSNNNNKRAYAGQLNTFIHLRALLVIHDRGINLHSFLLTHLLFIPQPIGWNVLW